MVRTDLDGLTQAEAAKRLTADGANTVSDEAREPLREVISKFWAPVPWLLEAAVILQLVLHDYVEAAIVFGLLVFNALLGYLQSSQAQSTLAAERGLLFAIAGMELKFLKPARLDDLLSSTYVLVERRAASLKFSQQLVRVHETDALVEATVRAACLDARTFRPRPIPDDLAALLS